MDAPLVLPFVVLMLIVFLFGTTKLSRAGRLSAALKPMVGKTVDVRIWGTPIRGLRVHSIRAFGAGLLFFLEPESGGKPELLKVAQPGEAQHDPQQVVIPDARYVQWRGARVPRVDGAPAFEMMTVSGVS